MPWIWMFVCGGVLLALAWACVRWRYPLSTKNKTVPPLTTPEQHTCGCPSIAGLSRVYTPCATCGKALCTLCANACTVCKVTRCSGRPCGGVFTACDGCDENFCVGCVAPREAHDHAEDEYLRDLPPDEVSRPRPTCLQCGCRCKQWRAGVDQRATWTKQTARPGLHMRAPRAPYRPPWDV